MAETAQTGGRPPIRRQARAGVHPTGGVATESPEVPSTEEVKLPTPVAAGGFEPDPIPSPPEPEPERVPGPAAMWARFVAMETKVEVMWLARQNAQRRPVGTTEWACAFEVAPGVKCGHRMTSTPQGMPKIPPLVCPDHGSSPHDVVE